ncbi:MAG: hypothetical protein MUE58_12345 [Chitinophagaceae bacterium]|nr:hypothetical protein [Chitinophagaceae bacterium]
MSKIRFIYGMALWMAALACSKVETEKPANPSNNEIRFVLQSLPGGIPDGTTELYALATLVAGNNAELVLRKRLSASGNGSYVSETQQIEKGAYRITRFLVQDGNGQVKFAVPVAQSEKAPLVQKPLHIGFDIGEQALFEQKLEVLTVGQTDRSEQFGYPAGTLNADAEGKMMIKLRAVVSIGDIVYDSLPALFKITSWDANGVRFEKDTLLAAGAKEIYLDKTHVRFSLLVSKWNVIDEMILAKEELDEGTTYVLGGAKSARKLLKDETFLFAEGAYRPSGKSLYFYTGNRLDLVEYYQKLPQFAELQLTFRDAYLYRGDRVERISRTEGGGKFVGNTDFFYNAQESKIMNIQQQSYDQQTGAVVSYRFANGQGQIEIDYLFSNGKGMEYQMTFVGGNKVEDGAATQQGGENGKYKYDFNINPYAHMNMPNLYLSHLSRNNMIEQKKGYAGAIPSADLYKIEYVYDTEGYPTEAVKFYRNYQTGEFMYKTKTVFTYR